MEQTQGAFEVDEIVSKKYTERPQRSVSPSSSSSLLSALTEVKKGEVGEGEEEEEEEEEGRAGHGRKRAREEEEEDEEETGLNIVSKRRKKNERQMNGEFVPSKVLHSIAFPAHEMAHYVLGYKPEAKQVRKY